MQKRKVIKTGNSLALTIPSSLITTFDIKKGDLVLVNIDKENAIITYQFPSRPRQLSLVSEDKEK